MKEHLVATFAFAIACSVATAQAVILPDSYRSTGVGGRISGIELIADDAVDDADEADEEDPIEIRLNAGYCTADPPKWKYVADEGVNYYEFCNHAAIPNYLKQDAHKKPASGGGIGGLRSKLIVPCSLYNGTDFLPDDVVADFCHD